MELKALIQKRNLGVVVWVSACLLVVGCSNTTPEPEPEPEPSNTRNNRPTASVGPDRVVERGVEVMLDGTSSIDPDGDEIFYSWKQTSGPEVNLQDAESATPRFLTPLQPGTVIFALTVSDGALVSMPARVNLDMSNKKPVVRVADTELGLQAKRVSIIMDATESSDPDGDILSFSWTQVEGASVVFDNIKSATPSFKTPEISGELLFEVVASDGVARSEPEFVRMMVNNAAPVADAGDDIQVFKGDWVVLDSSRSNDPDGDRLSFSWNQVGGPTAELNSTGIANAAFNAPSQSGDILLELTVDDGESSSGPSRVQVEVLNRVPIAITGQPMTVQTRTPTQLDGSMSFDADGDVLSYRWTQRSGPIVELSDPTSAMPTWVTPDDPATLIFDLIVFDGEAWSDTDPMVITVGQSYVGDNAEFATNPFRSTFPTRGPITGVMRVDQLAYLTDFYNGVSVVNLSDPARPFEVGFVELSGQTTDVAVQNNITTGQLIYATRGLDGLSIIDVSSLSLPETIGAFQTPGWATSVHLVGDIAWVTDRTAGLMALDVSNPAEPQLLGAAELPGDARDLILRGTTAYVADYYDGLQILDISDPTNPTLLSTIPTVGEALALEMTAGWLFLADSSTLKIFDLTNPLAPEQVGTWEAGASILSMEIQGMRLHLATSERGLQVLELSDPTNPVVVDTYDTPGSAWDVTLQNEFAYVADHAQGLQIIRTVDPEFNRPPQVWVDLDDVRELEFTDGQAWLVTGAGLEIIDPQTMERLGYFPDNNANLLALDIEMSRAYVVSQRSKMMVLDISDIANPTLLATWDAPGDIMALTAQAGFVYPVLEDVGFYVLDFTLPETPDLKGSYPISGEPRDIVLIGTNKALVGTSSGLFEFSISPFGRPNLTSFTTLRVKRIAVQGDLACVVTDYQGLTFWTLSSVNRPAPFVVPVNIDRPVDALFHDDHLFVATENQEIKFYDLSAPETPVWLGTWTTSSTPRNIALFEQTVLATLPGRGLQVVDVLAEGIQESYEFAQPGEALFYTPQEAPAGYELLCTVTAGTCQVLPPLEPGLPPQVAWTLPSEQGDHEIAFAIGNYHTFRWLGSDQVFIRTD